MGNRTYWFIHAGWIILFITLIGGFYVINGKIETQCRMQAARIDQVNTRTDQLYQMFIDLLKEQRNK